eukprot:3393812-Alexandrium_andersonii.AAC.1
MVAWRRCSMCGHTIQRNGPSVGPAARRAHVLRAKHLREAHGISPPPPLPQEPGAVQARQEAR